MLSKTTQHLHGFNLGKQIGERFGGESRSEDSDKCSNVFIRFGSDKPLNMNRVMEFIKRYFESLGYDINAFKKPTKDTFRAQVVFKTKPSDVRHMVATAFGLVGDEKLLWITTVNAD